MKLMTLGQLSMRRTIDEITETKVGGVPGSTRKVFGRDCAIVIQQNYSIVMHRVDDWDGKSYRSEDGTIWAKVSEAEQPEPTCVEIEFVQLNEVRAFRGAPAARFEVDGSWLWMSKRDIELNIEALGNHPELLKGLEAYASCSQMSLISTMNNSPTIRNRA